MRRHDFKKLKAWQLSKNLAVNLFRLSNEFPKEEIYGLTSQIRKSAISVPSNIAEGCGRGTNKQLCYFLDIAQGSAFEFETQLIIANEIGILKDNDYNQLISNLSEVQKMIDGFKNTLRS